MMSRKRVTSTQLETLYEYLTTHKDLATGYNKCFQAREAYRRLWTELAVTLNSHGDGAYKDWKGWSKYWNDFKSKLKSKAASARASYRGTGGGPPAINVFSDIEKKFFNILGKDFGAGIPGARVEPFEDSIDVEINCCSGLNLNLCDQSNGNGTRSTTSPPPVREASSPLDVERSEASSPEDEAEMSEPSSPQAVAERNEPSSSQAVAGTSETCEERGSLLSSSSRAQEACPLAEDASPSLAPSQGSSPAAQADSSHLQSSRTSQRTRSQAPYRARARGSSTAPLSLAFARRELVESSNRREALEARRNDLLELLVFELRDIKRCLASRATSNL